MFSIRAIIRKVVEKLIPKSLKEGMHVEVALSSRMDNAIELWKSMYENNPPWKGKRAICTHIPATIAEEMARLVLTEFSIGVSGGAAGEYINAQLERELTDLDLEVEDYCAKGGIVIKPYVSKGADGKPGQIEVEFIGADAFYPTAYNKREITEGIFLEFQRQGEYIYTRAEYHQFSDHTITITNRAFRSRRIESENEFDANKMWNSLFDEEVPLAYVDKWAMYSQEPVCIHNVDKPLFVYIRVPKRNHIDSESPLGISIYGKAVKLIKMADQQWDEIAWEYKAKETKIEASQDLFDDSDEHNAIHDPLAARLYRQYDNIPNTGEQIKTYSPDIRDASLFNGFNQYLRRIEWAVGFAYGTLSDPAYVEKTATEIRASQQRSYRTVSRIQAAWETGLKHLVYSMSVLARLYNLCPDGDVEVNCTWGDSVLEDSDKEFVRRFQMVGEGLLSKEAFDKWYFGCDDEALADILPQTSDDDNIPFDLK